MIHKVQYIATSIYSFNCRCVYLKIDSSDAALIKSLTKILKFFLFLFFLISVLNVDEIQYSNLWGK